MRQTYNQLSKEELHAIKPGDVIERMLAFAIPCFLVVQNVTDNIIDAGWTFDRNTGLEVDEGLSHPASYLSRVLTDEQKEIIKAGGKL